MATAIRDNLKYVMMQRGLSSRELAKRSNVKPSFIYDILSGKSNNPSSVKLLQVAECLHVPLDALVGKAQNGNGSEGAASDIITFIQRDEVVIPFDTSHRDSCATNGMAEAAHPLTHFDRAWLQQHTHCPVEALRLVEVADDSMSPGLNPRDVVMIDTSCNTPRLPGIYALRYGGEVIVKRLDVCISNQTRTVRLLSDNTLYQPIVCAPDEIQVMGKVIWMSKWL